MPISSEFATCYLFVDGGYVRARREAQKLALEFDPRTPRQFFSKRRINMVRCFYFDAQDASDSATESFFDKLRSLDSTFVFLGHIAGEGNKRRQKGVDMQLAIEALKVARAGHVDVIAIVAGDQDFVPLVEAIRDEGPIVYVIGFKGSISKELLNSADRKHIYDDVDSSWDLKP